MNIHHIYLDDPQSEKWNIPTSQTIYDIFLLVIKGNVTYILENERISLRSGEGLYIRSGTLRAAETNPITYHSMYSIHFSDSTPQFQPFLSGQPFDVIRPLKVEYIKQRLSALYENWIGKIDCYEMICQGILLEVLGIIKRDWQHAETASPAKRNLANSIQNYIVQHFREPIRMEQLAELVDRSPNYISSVFKEVTNYTPIEYMHQVRISTAKELISNTNMTIGEIADYLGYCDQTYFNYMYKKIVGQPPSHTIKTLRSFE